MKNKSSPYYKRFIAICFIAVIPLLIRVTMVSFPMTQYPWYKNETSHIDIYSYFKSHVIILVGLLALIGIIKHYYTNRHFPAKDPVIIISGIFASTIIISQLFSIDSHISRIGFIGRFEGYPVWLAYIAVFVFIYINDWSKYDLKILVRAFIISNVVLSFIGIFQYLGYDPLINSFTKPFITALNMMDINYTSNYTINYQVIVQSLYHYNYVAFYISMSFPIIASLFLYESNRSKKAFLGILALLILFNLLGSSSRGGMLGILATTPLFIFFNRKKIFTNKIATIGLSALLIVSIFGFEKATNGFISMRIKSTFTNVSAPAELRSVDIDGQSVRFYINDDVFQITAHNTNNVSWSVDFSLNDNPIEPAGYTSENKLYFNEPELKDIKNFVVAYDNANVLGVQYKNETWSFAYQNGTLYYVNSYGNFVNIVPGDSLGFEGRERLGSSRGYIWSKSLPLILQRPITGYGADTFVIAFPQTDYVGKYNAYGTTNMIVDKPHNTFLQIAINSGLISLMAYLALIITYYRKAIFSLVKNKLTFVSVQESIYFISILSFLITSFFNDSTVHVSPLFWGLLALASNHLKSTKART